MSKRHLTATALLASALVLTACGNDATNSGDNKGHNKGHKTNSAVKAKGNAADIAFLVGMTPHHEQAVEMSELVLAADPPSAVAAIATQIKDAQAPEIEQMKAMLLVLGEKPKAKPSNGGHSMPMADHGGMLSDAEMDALKEATGTRAARLYLEGMVRHHQGAIEASDTEIADGKYGPAIELAKTIKAAQAAEITDMQSLLKTL